eukprot:scaffold36833_cov100-Phaeocystis_antarctica.AAC.2
MPAAGNRGTATAAFESGHRSLCSSKIVMRRRQRLPCRPNLSVESAQRPGQMIAAGPHGQLQVYHQIADVASGLIPVGRMAVPRNAAILARDL